MPHLPNTSIVTQGKPSVLLGSPAGSKIVIKEVGSFKTTSLSEITGINLTGQQDGDVLIFNSTSGNYETGPIDGGTWIP